MVVQEDERDSLRIGLARDRAHGESPLARRLVEISARGDAVPIMKRA